MPKIDGMDPKLVRDLLAELRRAAKEMETIEAKATTTVRNAGVPAAVTYRPSAVADAIAEMDKDVTARLALLEKREREPRTQPNPTTSGDANPAPKPTAGETEPPPKKPAGETEPPKQPSGDPEPPKKPAGETEPPKKSDTETSAPNRGDSDPPPKKSDTETEPPKKGDTETSAPNRGDSDPPPKKSEGETPPPKGETPPPKQEPIDTPKKDHPDDIDQTKGRVVLDVDGTKVVSYPLNQDLDVVRPIDDTAQPAGTQPSGGPQPDGKPGYVEPLEPTVKHPAPQPGLDPGDPMGPYVGTAADNVTEDPFLKNNPAAAQPAPQPGLAPGDPMGAYVGTAADNVTEDPYLKSNPVTQPAPQPGLAPGDPMGAYVGTAADNVTEDPFLASAPQLPADTTLVSGDAVDPKALAAAQPGDVLSAPANPISDQALGTLLNNDSQIGPQGMPTVTDGSGSASGAGGNPGAAGHGPNDGGSQQTSAGGNSGNPHSGGYSGSQGGNDGGSQQTSAGGNSGNSHSSGPSGSQSGNDGGAQQTGNPGDSSGQQGGKEGQCGPQGGNNPAANGSTTGQAGLTTGPTMAHYGPAGLSADGHYGAAGQPGSAGQPGTADQSSPAGQAGSGDHGGSAGQAEIDPKKLAAEQPGDVLSAPAKPISDQALGALLNIDSQIGPQEMPSMTGGGSGTEGGPGHAPSDNGSDHSASAPQTPSASQAGGDFDPRRLAAEQAGDVLWAPADTISDQALRALFGFDDQIGPQETPSMGAGSEGGPGQGPAGGGPGQGAGPAPGAAGDGPDQSDPRRLAAEQPGDVLSAPAKPVSDEAILALMDVHAQIEPVDMPSVSVPAGEWGTGEWVPEDIEPDGPAGSVAPGQPA
ncbi:hypothetical protein GT755_21090 [Herbidospora sp. NEAU-GS84]|uniref:Uncharacterized protein n=1 Tax=Herbidospora solisilvae TaxID=2696284 RepID=A0A7C9P141_9ACTN|nr:hypothetical protein [Herbidospora solisilvae]NAS24177.1 hypothetical protein [Herbidospora solisilvae]